MNRTFCNTDEHWELHGFTSRITHTLTSPDNTLLYLQIPSSENVHNSENDDFVIETVKQTFA